MSIPIFIHSKIVAVIGLANKSKEYNESDVNQIKLLMGSVWGLVQRKKDSEKIAKLSFAVEQSSASIIITDVAGIVEYVNPKFTQFTVFLFIAQLSPPLLPARNGGGGCAIKRKTVNCTGNLVLFPLSVIAKA